MILAIAALGVLDWMRTPRLTPELRGHDLAARLGCFACHGAGGTGGVPNPGSEEKEVPSWDGGSAMMYVHDEGEIREWILDGHPARLADEFSAARPLHALPIAMPAYRDLVDDDELADLVAYYKAVARFTKMPRDVRAGYDVASRLGCFGCHGPGGLVGAKNPQSLKGYIPPWRGGDFRDLVRNDDELRQWIKDGGVDRLNGNRAARWFVRRQVIAMPAFRDAIGDDELEALVTYINWLNEENPE